MACGYIHMVVCTNSRSSMCRKFCVHSCCQKMFECARINHLNYVLVTTSRKHMICQHHFITQQFKTNQHWTPSDRNERCKFCRSLHRWLPPLCTWSGSTLYRVFTLSLRPRPCCALCLCCFTSLAIFKWFKFFSLRGGAMLLAPCINGTWKIKIIRHKIDACSRIGVIRIILVTCC